MDIRADPPSATLDDTPEIGRDGEELSRLSLGVGCDSTAQGKVIESNTLTEGSRAVPTIRESCARIGQSDTPGKQLRSGLVAS